MKSLVLVPVGLLLAAPALASETGQVISVTPVVQQVAVPQQVCTDQTVAVQEPKSGAGAALGAITGGVLGNAAGHGAGGHAAGTALGAIAGAIIGDRLEDAPPPTPTTYRSCTTGTHYENRVVAYNVVYEYAGKQYTAQMPDRPGRTIDLDVVPSGAVPIDDGVAAQAGAPNPVYSQQPVYVQPQTVYTSPPVVVSPPPQVIYPGYYYPRYYYPPVGVSLGIRYGGGFHHHH